MRNKYRIVNLLTLFATGWSKVPDMRFGQIIENLKKCSAKEDLFYLEDDEMEKLIIDYFDLSNNTKVYYNIVPIDDGYHYLANKKGEFVLLDKSEDEIDRSLFFENENSAKDYIKTFLNSDEYKVEEVGINEKVEVDSDTPTRLCPQSDTCPICGTYHPDGYVCTECLKKWGIYKPKEEYLY